jgi:hypothetical protein
MELPFDCTLHFCKTIKVLKSGRSREITILTSPKCILTRHACHIRIDILAHNICLRAVMALPKAEYER